MEYNINPTKDGPFGGSPRMRRGHYFLFIMF